MWCAALLAAGACVAPAPRAAAHGELDDLIRDATTQIAQSPRNPQLYWLRAELHRSHCDWDAAQADLERAQTLSNRWHFLHFARARLFLDAQWFQSAKVAADRFLAIQPGHAEALMTRARAQVRLGEGVAAARDYSEAIRVSAPPTPELYLERAQALAAEGGPHLAEALRGLEEGLAELGPLVTLQLAAIEIEIQQNHVDAALARIDKLMAHYPRKETWLARRGDILRQAGRTREAAEAFQAALQAMETLPATRRAVPAMVDLEKRIRSSLASLPVPASSPGPGPKP